MGLFEKLRQGLRKTRDNIGSAFSALFTGRRVDEALMEELEETLILADLGVSCTQNVMQKLRSAIKAQRIDTSEAVRDALKEILKEMLSDSGQPLRLTTKPSVVLMIGVNGVGKTTTVGKLAGLYRQEGKKVLLAAGDTFRAAAADQLEIWAQRADAELIRKTEGADPAAVIYDALHAGKARGCDVILCDTAGRLHNKANLMNELGKINRIIDRELPDADRETLLVLDATTGQNALVQAEQFKTVAGVTGLILTKLDGTAKGGIAVAVSEAYGLPIRYIGVGESMDDLMPFEAETFVDALFERE